MGAATVGLVAGCTDDPGVDRSADLPPWRISAAPVSTDQPKFADGKVRLSDGTVIKTGPLRAFVVAGDGVFFVPDGRFGTLADYELVFAAEGERPVGTGMVATESYLAASPDGRYLAVLSRGSGVKDRYGSSQATTLAFDLETGAQIIDSTLGMGDPATDDFAAGYSESEIGMLAMTDTNLYVQGDSRIDFDLATGEGEEFTGLAPQGTTSVIKPR